MIMSLSFAADEDAHRAKAIQLDQNLSQIKFDFTSIIKNQITLLQCYKSERANSWRSWSIFNDHTRELHLKLLKAHIKKLNTANLVDYVLFLKKEMAYAHNRNGHNYISTLNKMFTNLMDSLDRQTHVMLSDILKEIESLEKIKAVSGWHTLRFR